jgi:AICAR transformylase/IMP cyclohydrolase PurH
VTSRSEFFALEGQRVSLGLADGSRIDDVDLVSVGRGRASTLWLFAHGSDVFIPFADVIDLWAASLAFKRRAA